MAYSTRTRITALVAAAAMTMTACGSDGSSEVKEAQAQIDALQAQIDDLSETTTTAAPETTTTTAAPKPTTTVAAEPVVEEEPVEDTAAPETTVVDETASADAGDVVAVASGARLSADMGPDEVAVFLDDLIGPTDDFAGQVGRIHFDWPAIPTMPDTEIVSVKVSLDLNSSDEQYEQRTQAEFITSADPQDVATTYQATLAGIVDGDVSSSTVERDGRVIFLAGIGNYDIQAQTIDSGETYVWVTYSSLGDPAPEGMVEAVGGLVAAVPAPDGTPMNEIELWHFLGTPTIEVEYLFVDALEADVEASQKAVFEAAGWVPVEDDYRSDWETSVSSAPAIASSVFQSSDNVWSSTEFRYSG